MEVRKDEFPVVVQAYDTFNQQEVFVAEQVVNSQAEIENFTSRYTGKLIKARSLTEIEYKNRAASTTTSDNVPAKKSSSGFGWVLILLLLVVLVAVGFATGWIQETFNINI